MVERKLETNRVKNWDDLPNIKDRPEGMELVGIRLYISCGFVLDSLSHRDAGNGISMIVSWPIPSGVLLVASRTIEAQEQ
jgi:hypothetical protein